MKEPQPQSLSAVVELALQKNSARGVRDLARIAESMGMQFSHTMLSQLRKGTYNHPLGKDSRERLARLSGVPLRVINELAGAPAFAPFELPERAASLTGEQRSAVLSVVGAFIASNEALEQAEQAVVGWAAQDEKRRPTEKPGESTDPYLDT